MNLNEVNKILLVKKISNYLEIQYKREIFKGLFKSLSIIMLIFLIFSFIESFLYFNSFIRLTLVLFLIIFFLVLLFPTFKDIIKLIKEPKITEIEFASKEIGKHYPQVKDRLVNSIQLIEQGDQTTSKELTNAAFLITFKSIEKLNFKEIIDYSRLKYFSKLAGITFLTFTIFNLLNEDIRNASFRLINFNSNFIKPSEFSLKVFPGNLEIKKNDAIDIKIIATGNPPNEILLSTKDQFQTEYVSQSIKVDSNNIYTIKLRNIKNSFSYFAGNNLYQSETYQINVTSPPQINNLTIEIDPPNYSKLPKTIQNNNGNLKVLKGTQLKYNIVASKNLIKAFMLSNDSTRIELTVNKNSAKGSYLAKNEVEYFFNISDSNNNINENPIKYSIEIIQDNYPEIEITNPQQNSLIPQTDLVNLNYSIKDDFGFSKCWLKYFVSKENESTENVEFKSINLIIDKTDLEQSLYHNWDLTKLFLKENDIINYYLEIFDNDNVSGPKSTRSNIFKLRVPTLNELFAEIENTQDAAIDDLTKTMKEAEELKNELDQIKNELKKNEQKIEWNEKERIEQAVNKFEKVSDKIEDVKEKLEKMQNEMMQNNLLSEETMKKYNELQDLMNELSSEEMKKALEDMQNSLKDLLRDNVQNSLENLTENEKMFQKSIERTLNLLKKIQIEQKMDELIKRTEEIAKNLEDQKEKTENKKADNPNQTDKDLTEQQKNLEKQMNDLQKEMEKLNDKMKEVSDTPQKQMEELNKELEEQNNQEISEETSKELQKPDYDKASQLQNQLSQNMNKMQSALKQMQEQMQQQNQSMVLQNMLKSIGNIIELSKDQEKVKNDLENSQSKPNSFDEAMKNQMDLQQNLDNIFKQLENLSQKTFAISPEMGKALGDAKKNMSEALSGMQNKNGLGSSKEQGEAMQSLNEAAALMQNSLQNMMQGGGQGSGGMMSLMQQLQQMAQQQMGLNKQTQMLQQGKLTLQQQAQMQRLSQEQGAIQKSLEQLNQEAKSSGESKKLASNLEAVLNEMKEVISGLNTQKIDDELIKKQDKILSKLLDAQRSINERDFEEKRESIEGKRFDITSPDKLKLTKQETQDILREELLKAVKEGYSKDYQDLIRRYFESLNNSTKQN